MIPSDAPAPQPIRIFVTECPFKKSGFPVLGSFGSRVGGVVIFPIAEWERLCKQVPALSTMSFEVGTQD